VLRGPSGLAWRLQRGVLAAWLAGYVFIFAACGAAATGIGSMLGASAALRRYLLREGYQATLIHAYLSALMLLAGLAAAVYATSAVLQLRAEETGNVAEPVLATATGRIRWGLSHIWVAAGGACLLLATAGLSAGLGYGILTGSVGTQVPQLLGAALSRLPAVLVLAAVAVFLFGLLPWESTALAWTAVALAGGRACRYGRSRPALVEPGDQLRERGDVAVVPAGQPPGQAIPDGLRGGSQVLLPGGGKSEHAAPAPRPLAFTAQQPGRDQLVELPGQGGLVQAEVRTQVGRPRSRREVDLGQQRVGDQRQAWVQVAAHITGPSGHRGQAVVQVLEGCLASHLPLIRVAEYNSKA
jgi:hypothetical protein